MLLRHRQTLTGNSSGADSVNSQRNMTEWSTVSFHIIWRS